MVFDNKLIDDWLTFRIRSSELFACRALLFSNRYFATGILPDQCITLLRLLFRLIEFLNIVFIAQYRILGFIDIVVVDR